MAININKESEKIDPENKVQKALDLLRRTFEAYLFVMEDKSLPPHAKATIAGYFSSVKDMLESYHKEFPEVLGRAELMQEDSQSMRDVSAQMMHMTGVMIQMRQEYAEILSCMERVKSHLCAGGSTPASIAVLVDDADRKMCEFKKTFFPQEDPSAVRGMEYQIRETQENVR